MTAVVFTETDQASFPVTGPGTTGAAPFTGGQGVVGPMKAVVAKLVCDGGTCTATGDAFAASRLGLGSFTFIKLDAEGAGFLHSYDYTNGKIQSWISAGANTAFDEANTVAMSHTIHVWAVGPAV